MSSKEKQPIIVEEFIPAPGAKEKPWKKEFSGNAPQGKAFHADKPQMEAAIAAEVARKQGKSSQEIFESAKAAYEATPDEPSKPVMDEESALKIRWLKAVCRLGSGKFDDCGPRDLIDVAMLVDRPVIPFEQWVQSAKDI